jgi:membrane associated rhomboid family serine protease
MARFRNSSSMISFPPFRGATSQLVIANVSVYFLLLLMQLSAPQLALAVVGCFSLSPALLLHGWLWQLATYSFINPGVLHVAFNMLTLWFIGSFLESSKGSIWLLKVYFASVVGGALIGSALCFVHFLKGNPESLTTGSDAAIFGLLAAFGLLFGDLEMYMFPLPIAIKARYLVIVYMLIEIAFLLSGGPRLAYFTILGGAAAGLLYARQTPGKARARSSASPLRDPILRLRNNYYRWKRRRAARKFEVYMRKQNRDVRFDDEGRYIDPDEKRDPRNPRNPQNPNDRRWMN